MVSLSMAMLLCVAAAPAEPVLLHFSTEGCIPCRQMEPVVERLEKLGYPVRHIRRERDAELCRRFRVQEFPTFIVVVGDREIARRKGKLELPELEQLLAQSRASGESQRPLTTAPRETEPDFSRIVRSAVRLTVDDSSGSSYGSGTIIDERQGCALVLTCGHLFRDSQGRGRITVELFGPQGPQPVEGELLKFDLERDLGLVVIRPNAPVSVAKVAPRGYRLKRGDQVVSVGCNHGREPSPIASRVTATDKFLGPANVEVAGQPAQGRSGGGLFSEDGLVVGVCNAADPADDEGLYAAGPTIQDHLDACGLTDLYEGSPTRLAVNGESGTVGAGRNANNRPSRERLVNELGTDGMTTNSPIRRATGPNDVGDSSRTAGRRESVPPSMPRAMPNAPTSVWDDGPVVSREQLTPAELAALDATRSEADDAEVICIIRQKKPNGERNRVVVLDRASPEFLANLAQEQRTQDGRQLTSLDVERRPPGLQPGRHVGRGVEPKSRATTAPANPHWESDARLSDREGAIRR